MKDTEIFAAVQGILVEHLQVPHTVTMETDIQRDLALDSLRQLTFVVELENRFRICFEPEDERGLVTLGDVVQLVHRRLVGPRSRPDD